MKTFIIALILVSAVNYGGTAKAGDVSPVKDNTSSSALTIKAWEALSKSEFDKVVSYSDKCKALYGDMALEQQKSLKKFPAASETKDYESLNNVATCLFIKGEALFYQAKYEEAKSYYQKVIDKYYFAQYWDPKGWYWKVAEKSKAVLEKIDLILNPSLKKKKKAEISFVEGLNFPLYDEGTEVIVNYEKYGEFQNRGTPYYKYKIIDKKGLAKAVGEGIFPNNNVYRDPVYKTYTQDDLLKGSHWDYVNSDNLQANFYKWATAGEDPGVKLYYTAFTLEKAMHYKQAIKAYYALVVHYPKTVSWTYWKTPWYVGQVAIDKINYLTRKHPEFGMKLLNADIFVENGFDSDTKNDIITVDPGVLVKCGPADFKIKPIDLSGVSIIKKIGGPGVELFQYANGHWQVNINGKPSLIKAIAYTPTVIGQSPDKGTLKDWSFEDYNNNGRIDGPYDSWVDKNMNNKKDRSEEVVGDFKLLSEMGANAIRVYHHGQNHNKGLFRRLYDEYGIMTIMGDFLGAYATGSGATWHDGTDYSNLEQRENMKNSVRNMIERYKDEPFIMMWMLGNETNYGVANNAKKDPVTYYKFVNEVALMIKEMDPTRPVAICNGDTLFLDVFARYCPDIDIYGANSYRGEQGFGVGLWKSVKKLCDKPVLITEYGCSAYQKGKPREMAEIDQAKYHQGEWEDILYNSAGYGEGNALGGVVFEWLDEWWKAYEPSVHDVEGLYTGPFPGGWVYEEWFGIAGQGDGSKSPYLRRLRKSYYMYKKLWNE